MLTHHQHRIQAQPQTRRLILRHGTQNQTQTQRQRRASPSQTSTRSTRTWRRSPRSTTKPCRQFRSASCRTPAWRNSWNSGVMPEGGFAHGVSHVAGSLTQEMFRHLATAKEGGVTVSEEFTALADGTVKRDGSKSKFGSRRRRWVCKPGRSPAPALISPKAR